MSGQLCSGPRPPADCMLSFSLHVPERAASGEHCGLLLHGGLIWQKGKIREFFPSVLFHSLGKKKEMKQAWL